MKIYHAILAPLVFTLLVTPLSACSSEESPPGEGTEDIYQPPADTSRSASDAGGVDATHESDAADTSEANTSPDTLGAKDTTDDEDSVENTDATQPNEQEGAFNGDDAIEVITLSDVALDSETGLSETLSVILPDDAVSVSFSVSGLPGTYYALDELDAPSGAKLIPASWYSSPDNAGGYQVCLPCANRISASSGAHASLVPMSPSVVVEGGEYLFRIVSFEVVMGQIWEPPEFVFLGGDVEVSIVIKRSPNGLPATGRLDLNLHFTGAGGLNASNAPNDPRMIEALESFGAIYAEAGIVVGTVTYRDIDETFSFIDGIMGEGADFEAAAALTEGAPSGVNFIFVDEIVDSSNPLGGFGVILGVSGGIPGPIGLQGTPRSAVIVDVTPPEMAGDIPFGITMAHEMGHFLGLFHSSEMPFVNLHDPLEDTAENDVTNLMFFEASNGGTALSPHQGMVMRSNPWVRHETGDAQ